MITTDLLDFPAFCTSFNCPPGIPFFPVSYHKESTKKEFPPRESITPSSTTSKQQQQERNEFSVSIGLECGGTTMCCNAVVYAFAMIYTYICAPITTNLS